MAKKAGGKPTPGVVDRIRRSGLGEVDSRAWHEDWSDRWVVFADLVGFADRSVRSRDVVLNNILRFDRASKVVAQLVPGVRTYRFSDSTFGIAEAFTSALAFGVAMHHVCLASNVEYFERAANPVFIHTITPRITLVRGAVLTLPHELPNDRRFLDLDPRSLVAGEGIVRAYRLEKHSAGGLLTLDKAATAEFLRAGFRGGPDSMQNYLAGWRRRVSADPTAHLLFSRGDLLDVPWLLLRPEQPAGIDVWCASKDQVSKRVAEYLNIWELSSQELYSIAGSSAPLDVTKHAASAIRHGINCAQARAGQVLPKYYSIQTARQMLARGRAA